MDSKKNTELTYSEIAEIAKREHGALTKSLSDAGDSLVGDYHDLYSSEYLCDIFHEYADGEVDIYNADLLDWAEYNLAEIEEANEEYGQSNDIIKQIQLGQYHAYINELHKEIDDIIKALAYIHIQRLCDGKENETSDKTEQELLEFVEDLPDDIDSNDRISAIAEAVDDWFSDSSAI